MKFTEVDFNNLILSEVKKLSKENGLSLVLKENKQKLDECGCEMTGIAIEPENGVEKEKQVNFLSLDNFEEIQPEEYMEEAVEAKQLSEELSRMKQLLSFNNPLLKL